MPIIIILVIAIFAFFIFKSIKKSSEESERMNNHNKFIEKMNLDSENPTENIVIEVTDDNPPSADNSSLN